MAVSEVQVFKLGIEAQFHGLTDREKRYAHHMARQVRSQRQHMGGDSIFIRPPFSLGYPSEDSQSSYYPRNDINGVDAEIVSKIIDQNSIFPKNTRLQKTADEAGFEVLLASVEDGDAGNYLLLNSKDSVRIIKGDHSSDLQRVCTELNQASQYAKSLKPF